MLKLLASAGLAEAKAGPEGGYRLRSAPEAISLLAVVEAAEGPFRLERCILRGGPCHWEQACAAHVAWSSRPCRRAESRWRQPRSRTSWRSTSGLRAAPGSALPGVPHHLGPAPAGPGLTRFRAAGPGLRNMRRHDKRSADCSMSRPSEPRGPERVHLTASVIGAAAAVLVAALIYLGSRRLRYFDAALLGYACATVSSPSGSPTATGLARARPPGAGCGGAGRRSCRSPTSAGIPRPCPGRSSPTSPSSRSSAPRGGSALAGPPGVFWGFVLATLVTFPLTFGWIHFTVGHRHRAVPGVRGRLRGPRFDALSPLGMAPRSTCSTWPPCSSSAGAGWFLWRRLRDREPAALQRLGHDLVPLIALDRDLRDGAAAHVLEPAARGPLLRLARHPAHGRGGADAGVHPVRQVLPRDPATGQHRSGRGQAGGARPLRRRRRAAAARSRSSPPSSSATSGTPWPSSGSTLGLGGRLCPRCKRVERGRAYLRTARRASGDRRPSAHARAGARTLSSRSAPARPASGRRATGERLVPTHCCLLRRPVRDVPARRRPGPRVRGRAPRPPSTASSCAPRV